MQNLDFPDIGVALAKVAFDALMLFVPYALLVRSKQDVWRADLVAFAVVAIGFNQWAFRHATAYKELTDFHFWFVWFMLVYTFFYNVVFKLGMKFLDFIFVFALFSLFPFTFD